MCEYVIITPYSRTYKALEGKAEKSDGWQVTIGTKLQVQITIVRNHKRIFIDSFTSIQP